MNKLTSKEHDKKKIPSGTYCYTILSIEPESGRMNIKKCPYWSLREDKPEQLNGYCDYLGQGDWEEDGTFLLWDQVKECGENQDEF